MTGWLDGLVERWPQMGPNLWWGTLDTLYMVGWSTFFTALFGLPLGVLLVTTDERGLTLPRRCGPCSARWSTWGAPCRSSC